MTTEKPNPTPSRYQFSFNGTAFDVYRLTEIVGIRHHAQAHAFKKVIRAGQGDKPIVQDIDEAITALQRWREMILEDRAIAAISPAAEPTAA